MYRPSGFYPRTVRGPHVRNPRVQTTILGDVMDKGVPGAKRVGNVGVPSPFQGVSAAGCGSQFIWPHLAENLGGTHVPGNPLEVM